MAAIKKSDHQKWCEQQHSSVNGNIGKIYTRLGKMDAHIESHAACAREVRNELKALNKWCLKRDGATTALMWVAGISGTILVISMAVYKITS